LARGEIARGLTGAAGSWTRRQACGVNRCPGRLEEFDGVGQVSVIRAKDPATTNQCRMDDNA
jgi:hypothetical protein